MENLNKKLNNGLIVAEHVKTEEVKIRRASTSLTIKAFNSSINKLEALKMATKEEIEQLNALKKNIFERWIAIEMKM